MIGEDDILHPADDGEYKYSVSVQCITQTGKVMYIKKHEFLTKLQTQTTTWNLLKQQILTKRVLARKNERRYAKAR